MQIEFLGTGAGIPSKTRNVSSVALKMLDERNEVWLFDCGEATQHTILNSTIRPRKITKIFITHLHGDHIFGLPGLLSSRAFLDGIEPLEIYGPKGIKDYVLTSLKISHSHIKYTIKFIELNDSGIAFKNNHIKVLYITLKHGIQSYAYRIIENDYVGELQMDKLRKYNIPNGPIYGKIKRGDIVTLDDGTVINGKDFIGPPKKGRDIAIFGDTRYIKEHVNFAYNTHVIIHESTYGKHEQQMAWKHFHSTCMQAAELAKLSNAKQLYLTHISSRYLGEYAKQLQKDASTIFKQTKLAYDLMIVDVPFYE